MVPFRVFDRNAKEVWIVVNYHPNGDDGGHYLIALEDDDDRERDGQMKIIPATDLPSYKLMDFLEENEGGM